MLYIVNIRRSKVEEGKKSTELYKNFTSDRFGLAYMFCRWCVSSGGSSARRNSPVQGNIALAVARPRRIIVGFLIGKWKIDFNFNLNRFSRSFWALAEKSGAKNIKNTVARKVNLRNNKKIDLTLWWRCCAARFFASFIRGENFAGLTLRISKSWSTFVIVWSLCCSEVTYKSFGLW